MGHYNDGFFTEVEIKDNHRDRGITRVLNYHSPGTLYNKGDEFSPSAAPSPGKQSKAHAKEFGNYYDWPSKAMDQLEMLPAMEDPSQEEVVDGNRFLDLFQNRLQGATSSKEQRMKERKAMRKAERVAFRLAAFESATRARNVTNEPGPHERSKAKVATKKAAKARREADSVASKLACARAVAKFELLEKRAATKKAAKDAALALIAEEDASAFVWPQSPSDSPTDSVADTRASRRAVKIPNKKAAKKAALALLAEEEGLTSLPQSPSDSLVESDVDTSRRVVKHRNRRVVHDTDDVDDDTIRARVERELDEQVKLSTPKPHNFMTVTFPPIPDSSSPSPRTSLMSPDSPAFSPPSILARRKPLSGKSKAKRLDFETVQLESVPPDSLTSAMTGVFEDEAEESPTKKPRTTLRAKKVTPLPKAKRAAPVKTAAVTRAAARKATPVSTGKLAKLPVSREVPAYDLEDGDEPEIIDLTMLNTSDEDDEEEMKMVEIKMEL